MLTWILIGYLAIHLLGLSAGTLLLPPSPSYFRRQQRGDASQPRKRKDSDPSTGHGGNEPLSPHHNALQRKNDKTATELCSYAVVWWALLGMMGLANVGGGISRRMVGYFKAV
jgi:phosphatidylinositol glycan class W